MKSPFSPKTLAFLRALKRNNDRDWFRMRKPQYQEHMVELLARLAGSWALSMVERGRLAWIYRGSRPN